MKVSKGAIITGASRGIGRATAVRLANAGFSLFLTADERPEELAEAAEECRSKGVRSDWAIFDLATADASTELVKRAVERLGRVDVLVNNAAIRIRRSFGTFTVDEFDQAVAVNLRAPFLLSQAVLPLMRSNGGGRIIHVASQLGLVAFEESAIYGMTKAALIYLARAMAYELAREGIVVNAVSPGPIETEYNVERFRTDPALKARRTAAVPAGRYGQPDEVAEAILFLATSKGSYVQGHNLVIDGAYVAQ